MELALDVLVWTMVVCCGAMLISAIIGMALTLWESFKEW